VSRQNLCGKGRRPRGLVLWRSYVADALGQPGSRNNVAANFDSAADVLRAACRALTAPG